MDTYTVLLVDDEEEVTQVILKKINWEELGFSVIGYANNGIKALELVEEFQPDVVMTDIKMPYMDGMELSHHIKSEFPTTKILIFTGFDEFEYAKEAIHLEIEEYILKPVNSVELTAVFARLKAKLDQEISEKRNVETLKNYYLESLPLLRSNFYVMLVEGRISEERLPQYLADYQLTLTGPYFCCLVVHTSASQSQSKELMNPVLLAAAVQKQVEERFEKRWMPKVFSYLGETVLIARLNSEQEVAELTDECDRFCKYARRMIGAAVTIGIGQVCDKVLDLSVSYRTAREAVTYRAIYGAGRAINIKEVLPQAQAAGEASSANDAELSQLLKIIRLNDSDDVIRGVDQYLAHRSFPEKSLQQHYIDVMELVSTLCRFSVNNDIQISDFSGDMRKLYSHIMELEPSAFREWLIKVSLDLREGFFNARSHSTKSFVGRAKDYVHNNYADAQLSLDSICEVLGLSNSYFSTIFKKETGLSFIGFLTEYRLDLAARKLIETSEKSYSIAKQVGYEDPNYFSYVFKRRFGVSPSKYRAEYLKK